MYLRALSEKSSLIDCPRFRHLIDRLHALGPRPLAEFITAISGGADIMPVLERFAALDPETLKAIGADRWPASVFVVGSVRSGTADRHAIPRQIWRTTDGGDAA